MNELEDIIFNEINQINWMFLTHMKSKIRGNHRNKERNGCYQKLARTFLRLERQWTKTKFPVKDSIQERY